MFEAMESLAYKHAKGEMKEITNEAYDS